MLDEFDKKYNRKLADYTDWVGINACLNNTK